MAINIKVGTGLSCGCCGTWFETWEGYVDQDQDRGFGICQRCQGSIEESHKEEMLRHLAKFRECLNAKNQAVFDHMNEEQRCAMLYAAIDEGVVKLSYRGSK